jgi:hypothetical protein
MGAPLETWKPTHDWAPAWIESSIGGRAPVVFLWLFTLIWNAGSWFAMIETLRGNATGHTALAPLFPALGIGIFALACYVTLQHRKWGLSRIEMLTRPGVLGGDLHCVLHASTALAGAEELRVSVDCNGAEPGDGKIRLVRHLWHYEERVPRVRFEVAEETRVPLELRLPYDLPESARDRSADDAVWRLRVHAAVPGVDYEAHFALPVFRTSESSPEEEGSRVAAARPPTQLGTGTSSADEQAAPGAEIQVSPYGIGGREFVFGMLRNPWMGLLSVVSTFLFCGFSALILHADGPGLFLAAFVAATGLLAYSSVDTLFGITRVRAEPGRIRVRHGPFGIGPTRSLDLHAIERIRAIPQMQYRTGTYFQIRIERRAGPPGQRAWGRHVTAGTRIPTQAQAEALVEAMREAAGL